MVKYAPDKGLTIEITDSCSLYCIHCSAEAWAGSDIFLEPSQFQKYLRENPEYKQIRLSGGEPFHSPYLEDIAKIAKDERKRVVLMTSGICHDKELETGRLKRLKPFTDLMVFSIYGSKNTHDGICEYDGAFDLMSKSIAEVASLKIPFSFQTVALKANKDHPWRLFKEIAKFKERRNYCSPGLFVMRFIKQGRGLSYPDQALTRAELDEVVRNYSRLAKRWGVPTAFGCSLLEKNCEQGSGKMAIAHSGEKVACSALKYCGSESEFACKERW
jgi:MoaA/NifB/PqqE/SkfB family radical SAM enzyme